MLEITALLLCKLGGKSGNEADIKAVLEAAGVMDVNEEEALSTLLGDLGDDKDINALEKVRTCRLSCRRTCWRILCNS
jgi:ribosomal protein L12E/L44/L45/RPP1/RPP2